MSTFSFAVRGATTQLLADQGRTWTHLGCQFGRNAFASRQAPNTYRYSQSIRRLSTTTPKAEPALCTQSPRLGQDAPFERAVAQPKAFQTTSKPDHLLSASYRAHPIPRFEGERDPELSLQFNDGKLQLYHEADNHTTTISGRWLRDNCSCSQCRNVDTAQRQINVLKGNLNTDVASCHLSGPNDGRVTVTFGDGHKSEMPVASILERRGHRMSQTRYGLTPITIWQSDVSESPPSVSYTSMDSTPGMSSLLTHIRTHGFCFIKDMPATPEATESLLKSIGPIRETHYGGFYDFTSDLSHKDTAYTSEALEPHTDNTYFTEPAGLQALHMLSHTNGSGGESSLVDGFGAATQLYVEDREAYTILAETGVYAHASGNEGISIQPSQAFPTLGHDPEEGHLTQVRWNNADRAGIAVGLEEVERWYDAAAKFDKILNDEKNVYWFRLEPGRMVIFDNWRVLHGRASFTGKRRMCGGYIPRDDFISKYRSVALRKEDRDLSIAIG